MKRIITGVVIVCGLLLTGCAEEEPYTPPPLAQPDVPRPSASSLPTADSQLPNVENQKVDSTDPTDVAMKFVWLSTNFIPGDVFDPQRASERGYPLATERYRTEHAPQSNPDVVRVQGWWNMRTDENDPVRVVESEVELLQRPSPVAEGATSATRYVRSTQTPITDSGRELPARVQDATLQLVKEGDTWLVDEGTYTVIQE